jgi:nitrite reductase/ring-hydroxylating ferredoxin subunit/LAS superfamily LD-carboxypeptidase LdcB
MSNHDCHFVYAADVKDIEAEGKCLSLSVKKHPISLFFYNSKVYALDNRCPHMGFPLSQGTLKDGILTCHWHHARFDLHNGGAFDQWAGDVKSYPVQIRNNSEIWIGVPGPFEDTSFTRTAAAAAATAPITSTNSEIMLDIGLKRNISLIIATAVVGLSLPASNKNYYKSSINDNNIDTDGLIYSFRKGLEFGTKYKQSGWGVGLTIHTCMLNIATLCFNKNDKAHALYHGLSAVAQDCASMPPRFTVAPLPKPWPDLSTLKRWFRQFVESRNATAAERCLVTAIHAGADAVQLADILFAASTDHRFIGGGHSLDFTNKALEALDFVGWNDMELVTSVLSSLVSGYTEAERMEESSSWRHPIDLVTMLENAFKDLPTILEEGKTIKEEEKIDRIEHTNKVIGTALGDDPQLIVNVLLDAFRLGMSGEEIAGAVAYSAALRIAQFNVRNEFADWDAALHTFTFANAVHQSLKRISAYMSQESQSQSPATSIQQHELIRGIFDAAMRVYLNRFLNIPPAPILNPNVNSNITNIEHYAIEEKLSALLDKQQQVDEAAQLVADYYARPHTDNNSNNRKPETQLEQEKQHILMELIGRLLLREDRSFHLIQMIEAAHKQCSTLRGILSPSADKREIKEYHFILAAVRYLAAHSPTMRSQTHTYETAVQLSFGQNLFE